MVLESLKEDLRKRNNEIDTLHSHILLLDENKESELCDILKSNLLLMLYNKVEFFFREFVFSIYDIIHDNEVSFFELKPYIQHIFVSYLFPKNCTKDKKYSIIKQLFEKNIKEFRPEKLDIANGNIDGDKFISMLKLYKIKISFIINGEMKLYTLKTIRNQLSHGEYTFSEIGGKYTIEEINILKEEMERIFLAMQDKLEIFINDQSYLHKIKTVNDDENSIQ
ncbi:MAE_28990/MAE_18760 family HEPN-like nuclease [Lonepinella sp. BR2904]|uniref:MAE_28990/MAE_18760 family HEPN-like nuclease n=1 Tax=Lonepinella sp. BR2904 TaxID=3434551 RepID=UPI003F6E1843